MYLCVWVCHYAPKNLFRFHGMICCELSPETLMLFNRTGWNEEGSDAIVRVVQCPETRMMWIRNTIAAQRMIQNSASKGIAIGSFLHQEMPPAGMLIAHPP